jgi:hypothetical protein
LLFSTEGAVFCFGAFGFLVLNILDSVAVASSVRMATVGYSGAAAVGRGVVVEGVVSVEAFVGELAGVFVGLLVDVLVGDGWVMVAPDLTRVGPDRL